MAESFRNIVRNSVCGKGAIRRMRYKRKRNRIRRVLAERQGYRVDETGRWWVRCHWCGTERLKAHLTVDHIVRIADGGAKLDVSNLALACAKCNNERHANEREVLAGCETAN